MGGSKALEHIQICVESLKVERWRDSALLSHCSLSFQTIPLRIRYAFKAALWHLWRWLYAEKVQSCFPILQVHALSIRISWCTNVEHGLSTCCFVCLCVLFFIKWLTQLTAWLINPFAFPFACFIVLNFFRLHLSSHAYARLFHAWWYCH